MPFNSAQFMFVFLPLTLVLFFAVARRSHRAAAGLLTLASLIFYAAWQPIFLPVLLASTAGNYLIGERILAARSKHKGTRPLAIMQLWLAIGVIGNLALLGWFKYAGFLSVNLQALTGWPHQALSVLLPVGISFYTFTQIAYLVDAKRGLVDTQIGQGSRPLHYALFVTYFPHLIAGPILHHREMMPQFAQDRIYRFSWENFTVGLTLFAIGLVKKAVFADSLAPHVDAGFTAAQLATAQLAATQGGAPATAIALLPAWLSAIAFSLQIYFDYSGYSDMAIGASRMFGIHLPLNFNSPYRAAGIIDFWKRWNMTLARFLRDYLYIPLGGNRHGILRQCCNLMIVMLLGGLWHGAGWTFVIWGALHGAYLCIHHLWRHYRGRTGRDHAAPYRPRVAHLPGAALTFLAVVVAWVVFRAPDVATAGTMLAGMAGLHGFGPIDPELALLCAPLLLIAWFAPNSQQIMAGYHVGPDRDGADHDEEIPLSWWQWQPNWRSSLAFSGGLALALYLMVFAHHAGDFLYAHF